MLNVGINGFGRIGRAVCRINLKKKFFNVVAINDINPNNENLAYMLKYDSTYGRLEKTITVEGDYMNIEGTGKIRMFHHNIVSDVPWEKSEVDIVIDASGVYENLKYGRELMKKGIKKCIVTHSPDDVDKTIIMGVNQDDLDFRKDFLISSSICDANAFAPVMNVLNNEYGVDHGFLTTLHPWLQYQNLLDGPSRSFAYPGTIYEHFPLGRASTMSLIPKTTSCIKASGRVLRFLNERFQALSYRVPTMVVSSADISVKLNKKTNKTEIIELFKEKQKNQRYKIFYNNFEPLVSTDFEASEYSAIIDHRWTDINSFNYLKIVLWYDNEWGYSCRVVDLAKYIEEKL